MVPLLAVAVPVAPVVVGRVGEIGGGDGAIDLDAAGGAREFVVAAAEFELDAVDGDVDAGFANGRLRAVARFAGGGELDGDGEAVGKHYVALFAGLQIGHGEGDRGGQEK